MKKHWRESKLFVGAIVSLSIAAAILLFWLWKGWGAETAPRIEYLLFGHYHFGHYRYWDALLGLFGFLIVVVFLLHPIMELENPLVDYVATALSAITACFVGVIFQRQGIDVGSVFALATMAAVIELSAGALAILGDELRLAMIVIAGSTFGYSLCLGVVLGIAFTLSVAFIFAVIILLHGGTRLLRGGFPL